MLGLPGHRDSTSSPPVRTVGRRGPDRRRLPGCTRTETLAHPAAAAGPSPPRSAPARRTGGRRPSRSRNSCSASRRRGGAPARPRGRAVRRFDPAHGNKRVPGRLDNPQLPAHPGCNRAHALDPALEEAAHPGSEPPEVRLPEPATGPRPVPHPLPLGEQDVRIGQQVLADHGPAIITAARKMRGAETLKVSANRCLNALNQCVSCAPP